MARYLSNPREALKHLNTARRDSTWSSAALLAMAEIYLNPDNDISWAGAEGEADTAPTSDSDTREAINAAATLLQQLKPSDMQSSRYKVRALTRMDATLTHTPGLGWPSWLQGVKRVHWKNLPGLQYIAATPGQAARTISLHTEGRREIQ